MSAVVAARGDNLALVSADILSRHAADEQTALWCDNSATRYNDFLLDVVRFLVEVPFPYNLDVFIVRHTTLQSSTEAQDGSHVLWWADDLSLD